MSVILDALRKLDRERLSRRSATANIAVEILKPDLPRSGKRMPVYIVSASLIAIAAAAITYAVMLEFGLLFKSSSPAPTGPPVSNRQVPPALPDSSLLPKSSPLGLTSLIAPSQQVAPVPPDSGLPAKSLQPAPTNPPVSSQQVAPAPLSHESTRDARDGISRVPPKIQTPAESKTSETAERPVNGSPTTPPSLKISAIVWYEEPSKRFAMVNGLIVNEGAVIEGVRVEQIYPNRVCFSHNGRPFEISIK